MTISSFAAFTLAAIACTGYARAASESSPGEDADVATRVERAIEYGVQAAAGGVERGAKAAASGLERGAKAASNGVRIGVAAAASGVERGAKATARAVDAVAAKVASTEASGPK